MIKELLLAAAISAGTWRQGYKDAHAKALTFTAWEPLWDWAEHESRKPTPQGKSARSTDLAGGRHDYTDTAAAGRRDYCIGIIQEMHFIGNHNSGDTQNLFRIMQEWLKMQNPEEIVPPGHF